MLWHIRLTADATRLGSGGRGAALPSFVRVQLHGSWLENGQARTRILAISCHPARQWLALDSKAWCCVAKLVRGKSGAPSNTFTRVPRS